jgi:hypothetical protein
MQPIELELIQLIKEADDAPQFRYNELLSKLAEEKITDAEHREFIELTTLAEAKNAERLKYLVQLAQLWQTSVHEVMDRLCIKPPPAIHD